MIVYLDSSAIVKRYVLEDGSDVVRDVYVRALNGELKLSFSIWNIGEVLEVLDKYLKREWLKSDDYKAAHEAFIAETIRLIRLEVAKVIAVKTRLLIDSWRLVEKYHIYEADALQIVSAKYIGADQFLSGDKKLVEVSRAEGLRK